MKQQRGIFQVIVLLGLAVLLAVLPLAVKLVKRSQDQRSSAQEEIPRPNPCGDGRHLYAVEKGTIIKGPFGTLKAFYCNVGSAKGWYLPDAQISIAFRLAGIKKETTAKIDVTVEGQVIDYGHGNRDIGRKQQRTVTAKADKNGVFHLNQDQLYMPFLPGSQYLVTLNAVGYRPRRYCHNVAQPGQSCKKGSIVFWPGKNTKNNLDFTAVPLANKISPLPTPIGVIPVCGEHLACEGIKLDAFHSFLNARMRKRKMDPQGLDEICRPLGDPPEKAHLCRVANSNALKCCIPGAKLRLAVRLAGVKRKIAPQKIAFRFLDVSNLDSNRSAPLTGRSSDLFTSLFQSDDHGILHLDWSQGSEVYPGRHYRLWIKGPKHLAVTFCQNQPQNYQPCLQGKITLSNKQVTDLNLSAVPLPAGDIPDKNGHQDGVVDMHDFATLVTALRANSPSELKRRADLNFDGINNGADIQLFLQTISRRYDDAF